MAHEHGKHEHSASDKKLNQAAESEKSADETTQAKHAAVRNDHAKTAKHDDAGKDRLFEGRQQHDEAEKNSEKSRLAKDVADHHHTVDDDVADAGSGASAKRKS